LHFLFGLSRGLATQLHIVGGREFIAVNLDWGLRQSLTRHSCDGQRHRKAQREPVARRSKPNALHFQLLIGK
jgi:hypothetical protein